MRSARNADGSSTIYAYQDAYLQSTIGFNIYSEAAVQLVAPIFYFYLDLATANLATALGTAASIEAWVEFSLTGSAGEETWFAEQVTIVNELYDGGAIAPPTPTPSYYTSAQILALSQLHYDSAATDLTTPATVDLVTVPTGKIFVVQEIHRHIISATSPAAAETIKIGTDSDDDAAMAATALSYAAQGSVDRIVLGQPLAVAAGAIVRVTITAGATGSAASGRYIAVGYLISAS